jgi:excisionase family DNA binding protein
MLALLDQTREPLIADDAEAVIAKTAAERLKAVADSGQAVKITVDGSVIVPLPARAVAFIQEILEAMAQRTPVSLIPHDADLTTQQAADYLNVSRPYLIKQIENGKLPVRLVGTHRRIKFVDLLNYERATVEAQRKALAELHEEAVRLGLE